MLYTIIYAQRKYLRYVCLGDQRWVDHVPIACKDAIEILIISDLTRRYIFNNSINWYAVSVFSFYSSYENYSSLQSINERFIIYASKNKYKGHEYNNILLKYNS